MNKKNEIIEKVRREIARQDKPENKYNYQRFFKETLDDPIRIKTEILRKISNLCFKDIKSLPKEDILEICDNLLTSGEKYFRFFALDWARKLKKDYEKKDFKRFESWLKEYVTNWGCCDHFCQIMGDLIYQYPDLVSKTMKWTKSKNRWLRRAAAVSLITPVSNKLLLDDVFKVADLLMKDDEDLVQKGYGWMLKEASNVYRDEVFEYIMNNKDIMPRTALRYAIEKLPDKMRKQAMKKG